MSRWEEQLIGLERHIIRINNPVKAQRMKAWLERFAQIKTYPECRSLDDLGVRFTTPTVDLSLLYPQRQRRVAQA